MKPFTKQMIVTVISCLSCMNTICTGEGVQASQWKQGHTVLSHTPATEWSEALPIGNGRLGAMVFGSYPNEQIQLNEDTIWAQAPINRHKPGKETEYDKMWDLCLQGDYRAAHDIMEKDVIARGSNGSYQTLGDLWITHVEPSSQNALTEGTLRELDLNTGLITVNQALQGGGSLIQKIVSSPVDDCIAIELGSTAKTGLNFDLSMTRPELETKGKARSDNELVFEGRAQYAKEPYQFGTSFYTLIKVVPEGGVVRGVDDHLEVRGAQSVVVLITCATDYNRESPREPLPDGWKKRAEDDLAAVAAQGWDNIYKESASDLSALMSRCEFDIGDSPESIRALPTAERIKGLQNGQADPDLLETYFQFGRYLLACSSRPGTMPANLQGIWAHKLLNPGMREVLLILSEKKKQYRAAVLPFAQKKFPKNTVTFFNLTTFPVFAQIGEETQEIKAKARYQVPYQYVYAEKEALRTKFAVEQNGRMRLVQNGFVPLVNNGRVLFFIRENTAKSNRQSRDPVTFTYAYDVMSSRSVQPLTDEASTK